MPFPPMGQRDTCPHPLSKAFPFPSDLCFNKPHLPRLSPQITLIACGIQRVTSILSGFSGSFKSHLHSFKTVSPSPGQFLAPAARQRSDLSSHAGQSCELEFTQFFVLHSQILQRNYPELSSLLSLLPSLLPTFPPSFHHNLMEDHLLTSKHWVSLPHLTVSQLSSQSLSFFTCKINSFLCSREEIEIIT